MEYTKPSILIMAGIIVVLIAVKLVHKFYEDGVKGRIRKEK